MQEAQLQHTLALFIVMFVTLPISTLWLLFFTGFHVFQRKQVPYTNLGPMQERPQAMDSHTQVFRSEKLSAKDPASYVFWGSYFTVTNLIPRTGYPQETKCP